MDFSKFKVSDWLMVGGGAAMLILGFVLPWSSVSVAGISDSGDGPFNYFFTGGIAWLLVVAVGVLALLHVMGKLPATQPWPLIFLIAAAVATLLMLLRVVLGGRDLGFGVEADRGIGMILGLVWAIISLVGAFLGFQHAGGNLADLKDMNKMKSSFGAGGEGDDTPPPPPPPAPPAPPTPPPPPPAP